jgi:carbon-monoxide dehydrogenase medium subunit
MLAELGDAAKILAGGQSLIPMLALRLAVFDHLVDVRRIRDLRGIERHGDAVVISAATTESAVEASPLVHAAVPLLARATPYIGHFQIRNRGTVGGSMAHADPSAEYPAVAVALDAEMEALSPRGRRRIPAAGFFTGLWTTVLQPDELLVTVRFPAWSGRCGFAVQEFARRHGDFAIAGAVAGVELGSDDRVLRCAIGLIGLGSTPLRASAAEKEVLGAATAEVSPDEVGRVAVSDLAEIPSDMHGPADYRRRVGAAMVARALGDAIGEARHG